MLVIESWEIMCTHRFHCSIFHPVLLNINMQIDYLCWSIYTRSLWEDEVDFRVDYYLVWSHISIIVKGTLLFQRSFKPEKKAIRAVIHNSSARQKRCMHKIGCAYIIIQQPVQTLYFTPILDGMWWREGFICKRVTHWLIRYVCQWCTWAWEASWANSTKKKYRDMNMGKGSV